MDRRFKERLIGAAVLAGAAVLILPAVLNGPHAPLPEPAAPAETAMRTETIELERASGSRGEPATKPPTASSRPSPEAPAASSVDDSGSARAAAQEPPVPGAAAATSDGPRPGEQADESASAPAAKAAPAQPPAAKPTSPNPSPAATPAPTASPARPVEAAGGWAVQVGTFASSANATALAATLKGRGYPAFVAPLASGDRTLYRVRVGPTPDVESAHALEQRLEKEMPAADVVRQP